MKRSLSILTVAFVFFAFLISCGGSGSSEPGSIFGVVTDKVTGEPLKDAGVKLGHSETITGSDGLFEFNDISAGTYILDVTKDGYAEVSSSVTLTSGERVRRDIQLKKLPPELHIIDNNGNDMPELNFGDEPDAVSRQFRIWNAGGEKLKWEISFSANWITSVTPESGELSSQKEQAVIVYIDRSLLESGENTASIHITSNNGNKQLPVKATDENPCKYDPCGHGTCKWTGGEDYECECDDGYYQDSDRYGNSFCVNPCEENPCGDHGSCKAKNATDYECDCDEKYFWDGSKKSKCINPCENNPCGDAACTAKDHDKYICDLCNPNPCGNGTCSVAENSNKYECKCDAGNFFDYDYSQCIPMSEMAECSTADKTPCKDSVNGLIWSDKTGGPLSYSDSVSACSNLARGGFTDWRIPNIDELRSLLNCSNTGTDGVCQVSAATGCLSETNCWSEDTCGTCGATSASTISKFGDSEAFWSSSVNSDGTGKWLVDFSVGKVAVSNNHYNYNTYVRCVRTAN